MSTVLNPTGNFPTEWDSTTIADSVLGFPATNEATAVASNTKLWNLISDGVITDKQIAQVLRVQLRPFWDANAEAVGTPTGAYTGTAGTTSRFYVAVPRYELNPGPGNGGSPQFMNFTSGPPPEKRNNLPGTANVAPVYGGGTVQTSAFQPFGPPAGRDRTARFAPPGAAVTVVDTAATLTTANYVTVTAPALPSGHIDSLLTYDIVAVSAATSFSPLYLVAKGVAPSATCVDNGSNVLESYVLPTHAEVAKGPTSGLRIDIVPIQVEDFSS